MLFAPLLFAEECINYDLTWPKLVITESEVSSYATARQVLDASAKKDQTGESEFYRAAIEHRLELYDEVLVSIEQSVSKNYYFAHAFLVLAFKHGYMGLEQDLEKSKSHFTSFREIAADCNEFNGSEITEIRVEVLVIKLFDIPINHNKSLNAPDTQTVGLGAH